MHAENRIAVAGAARGDLDQYFPQGDGGADSSAEDRNAIWLGLGPTEMSASPKPAAKNAHPLQYIRGMVGRETRADR